MDLKLAGKTALVTGASTGIAHLVAFPASHRWRATSPAR